MLPVLCFPQKSELGDKALDSLIAAENAETSGTEKLRIIRKICLSHYNIDTVFKYAQIASVIAKNIGDEKNLAFAYSAFSWCDYHRGEYQKSLGWAYMALGRCEKFNEPLFKAHCYRQLGYTYYGLSDFYNADRFSRMSLKLYDSLGISNEAAAVYRTLGVFCMEYGFFDMGENYVRKAYQTDYETYPEGAAEDIMYFGYSEYLRYIADKGRRSLIFSALQWYKFAWKRTENQPNTTLKSRITEKIALTYNEIAQMKILKSGDRVSYVDSCIKYSMQGIYYAEKTGSTEKKFIANYTLANSLLMQKKIGQAEEIIGSMTAFIEKSPERRLRFGVYYYKVMIKYANMKKDYKAMCEYTEQLRISTMKRYNYDLGSKIGRIQAKEDYQRKADSSASRFQKHNDIYQKEYKEKEIINQYLLFAVLIFAAVAAYILFVSRQQTKINVILQKQSLSITGQNNELSRQEKEFRQLRRKFLAEEAELQKKKKKFVKLNQSIHYSLFRAQEIQKVLIPSVEMMEDFFGECLVYFKPLQMVSGDFYWALKTPETKVLVTADCTGHGIPGGFLSMLGISSLNDIVRHRDLTNQESLASDILEDMRRKIITSLHQTSLVGSQNDSIDMAVCVFGKNEGELQYAGANRPLWISGKDGIKIIDPDEFSTGMDFSGAGGTFTNHKVKCEKGEIIYTFSDGITDQFGGTTGRIKFGAKRLKELLLDVSKYSFLLQYKKIEETIYYWTARELVSDASVGVFVRQVDDQLLIGVKI